MARVFQEISAQGVSERDFIGAKSSGWKPYILRDIQGVKIWPQHVENLLESSVNEDATIHFVGAALAYTMFVEVGFVPLVQNKNEQDLDPEEIVTMQFKDYMLRFGSKYPSRVFSKDSMVVKFKVVIDYNKVCRSAINKERYSDDDVNSHLLLDIPYITNNINRQVEKNNITEVKVRHPYTGSTTSLLDEESRLKDNETGARYRYSSFIKMIMRVKEDGVEICIIDRHNAGEVQQKFILNILLFCEPLDCMAEGHNIKKPVREWLQLIKLNGSKLSSTFKQGFVMKILDNLGGMSHELRGIQSLPPEVLIKILKSSEVQTVGRVARTSTYLRSVTQDKDLWEFLLKRDFPVKVVSQPSLVVAGTSTEETWKQKYRYLLKDERDILRLQQQRNDSQFTVRSAWSSLTFIV